MAPFMWHVEEVWELRRARSACEHAAATVAPHAPPHAIERYVERCAHAEQMARLADMLVMMIGAFGAPAIFLGIDGPYGILAGIIFVALWAFVGLDQCMAHIARVHTSVVADACSALTLAASEHHQKENS
jgi:hypothetical protein